MLVLTGEQKTLLVVLQPRSVRAMALYQALPPMFERRSGAAAAALHGQIYAGVLSGDQSIGIYWDHFAVPMDKMDRYLSDKDTFKILNNIF